MSKRQFLALFLCNLVLWTVGNGMLPLLPVYAAQIGAELAVVGYYLSFCYLTLAAGTVVAGWLSDKLQRRKMLLIVGGVVGIPATWVMGRATNIWHLAALTATVWFVAGVMLTLLSILAGLFAEEAERGRVFGILSLTSALGMVIAGVTMGPVAERWGYPTMFVALSLFWSLSPLTALLVEDRVVERGRDGEPSVARGKPKLGGSLFLLLLASLTAGLAFNVAILSRSLVMNDLGLGAAAISSTGAISGMVTLALVPLLSWLSDRVGRKRVMALCYLAGTVGLLALPGSVSLWHFWVAISLVVVMSSVVGTVGLAMVTDLVPQESLGRGLSLFTATTWVGGIIANAGTGYAVESLGVTSTLVMGAFLPLIGIVLLIPIRRAERG